MNPVLKGCLIALAILAGLALIGLGLCFAALSSISGR
jgi:hypothetical protein